MKCCLNAIGALAVMALCTDFALAGSEENPADFMDLHQVEIVFHTATSTKNLELMMSLFADDAILFVGGKSYSGKDQVRGYFARPRRERNVDVALYTVRF
jgi:ketosteroid isomerase-like protein